MLRDLKILILLMGLGISNIASPQVDFNKTPDDDLGNIEDKFQEFFFEGLKQKAIENYDRSILRDREKLCSIKELRCGGGRIAEGN